MTTAAVERAAEIASSELFELAPVAMSIIDLNGRQLAANRAFHELFGSEVDTEITVSEITHPDEAERTESYLDSLATNEAGHVVVDKGYRRPDGTDFQGRLLASTILDESGAPILLLGMIDDVSEHHALVAELQAVSEAKTNFIARVSHDVRTPLHSIGGLAELLAKEELTPAAREYADAIVAEAAGMRALVDDLLDLAQIETGAVSIAASPFDLQNWLTGIHAAFERRLTGADVVLGVETGAELHGVVVVTDSDRLRQIVANLVDNACKFTDSGSISIVASCRDGELSVSVADTGRGIAADVLPRVFEPFVQSQRDRRGAGLGLAVAKQLAAALGGDLTATSELDFGSTFTVTVPVTLVAPGSQHLEGPESTAQNLVQVDAEATTAEQAAHSSHGLTHEQPDRGSRAQVLIVEDVEVNRLLITSQLDRLGVSYELAEDGATALELLDLNRYDLVLMDWHLPDMDGLEVTRRFRSIERGEQRTPTAVVAVTARAMSDDRHACLEAGMDDFLPKPVSLPALERMITTWIGPAPSNDDPRSGDGARAVAVAPVVVVDKEIVNRLVDDLGDRGLVATLIETYLGELPGRAATIATATDPAEVGRAAHTLASMSATVGASALAAHVKGIEQALRDQRPLDPGAIDEVNRLSDATRRELDSLLSTLHDVPVSSAVDAP